MFTPVTLSGVTLGEGAPKIIVPLTGTTIDALLQEVSALEGHRVDIVEWRIDHLAPLGEGDPFASAREITRVACELRTALGATPLLITFRTAREGGAREISPEDYRALLLEILEADVCDAIDVEAFAPGGVETVVETAHAHSVVVVASNHDFDKTPERAEIVRRLRVMQDELGADIPKIAVMPRSVEDVLTLLAATHEMTSKHATRPLITMSMGPLGVVSRLAGETFGSAATFGAVGSVSAPGQVNADALGATLELIHGAQG